MTSETGAIANSQGDSGARGQHWMNATFHLSDRGGEPVKRKQLQHIGAACSAILLIHESSHAQVPDSPDVASRRLEALNKQVGEQAERLDALKRSVAGQEASLAEMRRALQVEMLTVQRGGSAVQGPAKNVSEPLQVSQAAQQERAPVGRAPERDSRPPEVAPIFEQPGVLTPRGKFALEPSLQFGYSSSNRVAIVGYTIIPALLIGLLDVREVKRNVTTAALTARFGVTNRFELEARVPYVYRSDSTVSREVLTGTAVDKVFEASGRAIGDVELGARYQLNEGGVDKPYYIGTLRVKSRTGKDPFEVVTDCVTRCVGNTTGTGLPLQLPTGSGFYSLQPGLTWIFPSDPAVFFGSFSYLHNFKRQNVKRKVSSGEDELLGTVAPGDVVGFNFGMGLALNEKASFSVGYDHNSVGRTRQGGKTVPGSVRTQLGTLLLGYSYRLTDKTSLSVSVGAGLTRDTPDVTLGVKLPMSF
jgi:uncharacterized coiled-coil protein SlyX